MMLLLRGLAWIANFFIGIAFWCAGMRKGQGM